MSDENNVFEWPVEFYEKHWDGMPVFDQPKNSAFRQIIVSFEDEYGVEEFAKLTGQNITEKTKSIWFPDRERNQLADLFWFSKEDENE